MSPTDALHVSVLAIVPAYLSTELHAELLVRCLVSLATTAPQAEVLVVDDGSPAGHLVEQLAPVTGELGQRLILKSDNEGLAPTVNVGLRLALAEGRDALVVHQDVEFMDSGWLPAMLARTDGEGRPAAVVGAKLLFPSGLIQHAGMYCSRLSGLYDHRFRHGPVDLVEANRPHACPVTSALQLIRHDTLEAVGLYDEGFAMGFEDVDYGLRTFDAGLACVYEPAAWALHHEGAIRGGDERAHARWRASWQRHRAKNGRRASFPSHMALT